MTLPLNSRSLLLTAGLAFSLLATSANASAAAPLAPQCTGGGGDGSPPPPPPPPGPPEPPPTVPDFPDGSVPGSSMPGPSTPGPTGPSAPPRSGPSTPGPGGPAAPRPSAQPRPAPITGSIGSGDATGWRFWWDHNRDAYLGLRQAVRQDSKSYGDEDFYIGNRTNGRVTDLSVRDDQLTSDVLPALVIALQDKNSAAMRRRALLAFAKLPASYCKEQKVDRFQIFKTFLADPDLEVCKTAALGLGLIGGADSIDTLEHLLMGCTSGEKLIGRSHIPYSLRTNAAYAMGLAGAGTENLDERRFALHFLNQAIRLDRSASPDVISSCVSAIGVIPMPVKGESLADALRDPMGTSREAQIASLFTILEDEDHRRITRAHTITAIARLTAAEGGEALQDRETIVKRLTRYLSSSAGAPREMRQSVVLALGMLADSDSDKADVLARKALMKSTSDADHLTRFFAMISLGQAAGRAGDVDGDVLSGSHEARKHLLSILAKGKSGSRPWAAIALGLLGHGIHEGGYYPSEDASRAIGELLRETKSPEIVGALALSLGLRGDGQYRSLIEERLESLERDDVTGSELALALGLIGAANSEKTLRDLSQDATHRPYFLKDASIARALVGDTRLLSDLVEDLGEAETLAARFGVANALAFVGDQTTIAPISASCRDENVTELGRSYLLAALGEICDERELPWTATYSIGVNYGAAPESLEKGVNEGLLNMD